MAHRWRRLDRDQELSGTQRWIRIKPGAMRRAPDSHDPSKRHAPIVLIADLALGVAPARVQLSIFPDAGYGSIFQHQRSPSSESRALCIDSSSSAGGAGAPLFLTSYQDIHG